MTERKYKVRSLNDADFDEEPLVEGIVKETGIMTMPDKRKAPYIIVDGDKGLARVWVSTDLEEVYKAAKPGDHIKVRYLRTIETKGKRTMKKFASELWTEK